MSERTRGIIVQPVKLPEGADFGYEYGPHAVAADHAGQAYVICQEGVGHAITADEFASCTVDGPPIDLADFIRTFGSRLDVNHYMWVRKLGGTYVVTGTYRTGRRIKAIKAQQPSSVINGLPDGTSGTVWFETPDGSRTRIRDYAN